MKLKQAIFCILWGFCLIGFGCARTIVDSSHLNQEETAINTGVQGKTLEDLSPRAQASLRLTEQARLLLESGKAGDAIMILERAINLNPANGLNYYYMAEAWLYKGNFDEALKFNGLAESCIEASSQWRPRIKEQGRRIEQLVD